MFQDRNVYIGNVSLPTSVSTWAITGLALKFAPTGVIFTPMIPAGGGQSLTPRLLGPVTTDGFNVDLGITTDVTGYGFTYFIV